MTLRIIGEGLDALIFACTLARRNVEFEWLVKNNHLGGYFRGGRDCQGKPIDLGMVFLEPNHYGALQSEINAFRGETGQSARPFINSAYELLVELVGEYETVETKSQDKHGENSPDYFLSDRLFAFKKQAKQIILEIEDRIIWLKSNPEWHPRFKLNQESVLFSTNIPNATITLYGKSYYNLFFKNYVENCLGKLADSVPAGTHRRAWVPLYWPETILEYLLTEGDTEPLFQPVFARFSNLSISGWVFSMIQEIELYKKKKFIFLENYIKFKDLDIPSENVYAFVDSSKMLDNVDSSDQKPVVTAARITVVHFCCTVLSANVIFLRDDESKSYRISLTPGDDVEKGKISIEYGEISADLSDEEILSRSIKLCERNGITVECIGKIHKGKLSFNVPTEHSDRSIIALASNKQTLFSSVATSFNDNIIRAAWADDNEKRKKQDK